MKRIFFVLNSIFFLLIIPNFYIIKAAPPASYTCPGLGGHCTPLYCGYGPPISAYGELDCTKEIAGIKVEHCCPNPPAGSNCTQDLGGSCSLFCIYGEIQDATGCFPLKCCLNPQMENPNQPQTGPILTECPSGGKGIETAIGCIPTEKDQSIAKFFLTWGFGIASGIALVMIVFSGILISTASGDPRKLQSGKELFIGAISGLLLLVLSAFILRAVGSDILGIF